MKQSTSVEVVSRHDGEDDGDDPQDEVEEYASQDGTRQAVLLSRLNCR